MKTAQVIKEIKQDAHKLYVMFQAISVVFNRDKHTMVSVLLQNLQFDGSTCQGYNEEKELERMYDIKRALEALAAYDPDDYVVGFIVSEVDMSFMGATMVEEDFITKDDDSQ